MPPVHVLPQTAPIFGQLATYLTYLTPAEMALMKAALAWERFVLKDLTTFARYAKVLLVSPLPSLLFF